MRDGYVVNWSPHWLDDQSIAPSTFNTSDTSFSGGCWSAFSTKPCTDSSNLTAVPTWTQTKAAAIPRGENNVWRGLVMIRACDSQWRRGLRSAGRFPRGMLSPSKHLTPPVPRSGTAGAGPLGIGSQNAHVHACGPHGGNGLPYCTLGQKRKNERKPHRSAWRQWPSVLYLGQKNERKPRRSPIVGPTWTPPPCATRGHRRSYDGGVKKQNEPTRAYAQQLVTTRLLDCLHDPVGRPSRLQGFHPRAR